MDQFPIEYILTTESAKRKRKQPVSTYPHTMPGFGGSFWENDYIAGLHWEQNHLT